MSKSLLFIPDISGFTEFVQRTEVEHSQHVISELLEILIKSNIQNLALAEIEGDALFFYKENEVPSKSDLLIQVETMFTAFYSHLQLLETNRICPCNACAMAPKLQLKIIAHSGELQFITVQNNRKPFGSKVIEAHRLMKNSVESDNYTLFSRELADDIQMDHDFKSDLFDFSKGKNAYDGKEIEYLVSVINQDDLNLNPFAHSKKVSFDCPPSLYFEKSFPISAPQLFEYITNYNYRHHWVQGVDRFEYDENEITRLGTEHVCVINEKHLDFIAVTKDGLAGQLIYGELTTSPPPVDELYQFYIITPLSDIACKLEVETYWRSKSPLKKLAMALIVKKGFQKRNHKAIDNLYHFVKATR